MNKEIASQTLLDSFEVIKDNWITQSESIQNAIDAMFVYNGSLAAEMWAYVLNSNKTLLEKDSKSLIYEIFEKIINRANFDYENIQGSNICRNIGDYIFSNDLLCKLIYQDSFEFGYRRYENDLDIRHINYYPTVWFYAYLLTTKNYRAIHNVTLYIINNAHTKTVTASIFLSQTVNLLINYFVDKKGQSVTIKDDVKSVLLECSEKIQDPVAKADLVISILSLK